VVDEVPPDDELDPPDDDDDDDEDELLVPDELDDDPESEPHPARASVIIPAKANAAGKRDRVWKSGMARDPFTTGGWLARRQSTPILEK
jgi:hypothetical protein